MGWFGLHEPLDYHVDTWTRRTYLISMTIRPNFYFVTQTKTATKVLIFIQIKCCDLIKSEVANRMILILRFYKNKYKLPFHSIKSHHFGTKFVRSFQQNISE